MDTAKDRFIEAATRSLDDSAETQAAAVSLLEQNVDGSGRDCDRAVARWNAVDKKQHRFGAKAVLYLCLVIVSGWVWVDSIRILVQLENSISCMCGSDFIDVFHNSPKVQEEDIAHELSDSQKMLLFGDMSKTSKVDRMKGLWETDPTNPAFFTDYSFAYFEENKKLPPDFLQIARRIDPDNAWFSYIAAGSMAINAVKRQPQTKSDTQADLPPEWLILDAAAFEKSLQILREARGQTKHEYPLLEIQRERIKLLPTRTPAEVTFAFIHTIRNASSIESQLRGLGSVIAAKAWLCGKNNDSESFRDLLIDANRLLEQRASSEVVAAFCELVNTMPAFEIVTNTSPVATQFGIMPDASRLESALESVNRRKALLHSRKRNPNNDLIYQYGGELAGFVSIFPTSTLEDPHILLPEELVPGRLMDHETVAWTGAHLVWCILVITMGASVGIRRWQPPVIRHLAVRMERLMLVRDWLLIVVVGVAMPILYFTWITRFTPWGGRELSMMSNDLNIPYLYESLLGWAQQGALALLMILSIGATACCCVRRRTRPLGLVTLHSASLLVPIVCCAAFIPISGWQVVHPSDAATAATLTTGGITLGALLLIALRMRFGPSRCQLRHAVVGRILVPCCAFGALLAIASAPIFKHLAYQWSAKDTLVRMDKDFPAGSEFEHRVALQYRKELRQTLGYDTP